MTINMPPPYTITCMSKGKSMLCTGLRGRAGRCGYGSRPSAFGAAPVLPILLALLFVAGQVAADVTSTTGNIFFNANNDGVSEAVITTTGLDAPADESLARRLRCLSPDKSVSS